MGMIKERIRSQEQNQRHRALVEENRRQKMKRFHHHEPHKVVSGRESMKENRKLTDDHSLCV